MTAVRPVLQNVSSAMVGKIFIGKDRVLSLIASLSAGSLSMQAVAIIVGGVVVIMIGNAVQCQSHVLLSRLSKSKIPRHKKKKGISHGSLGSRRENGTHNTATQKTTTATYSVPHGGLFELVSCPHYFAEIVIYAGFVVLQSTANAMMWYALIWVVINLSLAAQLTHCWYQEYLKDYPKNRKALIPFVY